MDVPGRVIAERSEGSVDRKLTKRGASLSCDISRWSFLEGQLGLGNDRMSPKMRAHEHEESKAKREMGSAILDGEDLFLAAA